MKLLKFKYSQFVYLSKKLCIILAAILISAIILPFFNFSKKNIALDISNATSMQDNDQHIKPHIINPQFNMIDKEYNKYTLVADHAIEQNQDEVLLDTPKANILLSDNKILKIMSKKGKWHQLSQILRVTQDVDMLYQDFEARTKEAIFDLVNNIVIGYDPVTIRGEVGDIDAQGFRALIKDKKIYFTGPVTMIIKKLP